MLNIRLLLILLTICPSFYAQITIINDIWSDDFQWDADDAWYIVNDGSTKVNWITDNNNKKYHGRYTNYNPSPLTSMSRYFQCQQASYLYISYRFLYCGATDAFGQSDTDTVTLKYNDQQKDYDDLDRNISHSHLYNDSKLVCGSGADPAHETYRYKDKNVYLGNISAITNFKIEFIFEITDDSEFVVITDIEVNCSLDPPPPEPTTNPTSTPSKMPTYIPTTTQPTTVSPTQTPSAQPSQSTTESSINPTNIPSQIPTNIPSKMPTIIPSKMPTFIPSKTPIIKPSKTPTTMPTSNEPTKTQRDGEMFTTTNDIDSGGIDIPENADKLDIKMILIIILVGIILLCCCIVCYSTHKKRKQTNKKQQQNMNKSIQMTNMSTSSDMKSPAVLIGNYSKSQPMNDTIKMDHHNAHLNTTMDDNTNGNPDSYITDGEDDVSRDSDLWHNGENEEQEGGIKGKRDNNNDEKRDDSDDIYEKPIDDRYITPLTPNGGIHLNRVMSYSYTTNGNEMIEEKQNGNETIQNTELNNNKRTIMFGDNV